MKITDTTPKATALNELGKRLAQLRKHQELTQEALAEASGVGVATLRRIEDGRDAQLGSWIKLLLALNAADSLNSLLPESIRSPMADVKQRRRKSGQSEEGRPLWGDEQDE